MREYLFRGRTTNGYWVYGSLIHVENYCCILDHEAQDGYDAVFLDREIGWIDGCAIPVDPKTVGQYTGFTDANGKKIFEGDIMRNAGNVVEFCNGSFCINGDSSLCFWTKTKIIGNIHDKPKLLEET